MNKQQKSEAKREMMELMLAGYNWQKAAKQAGIETSEATAYRWKKQYQESGASSLLDNRQGHVFKMRDHVLKRLEEMCKQNPSLSGEDLQKMLIEQMGLLISVTHLNRTRAAHGWTRQTEPVEKKKRQV